MLVGYARVSTQDQTADLQIDALREAGCDKIFVETASGSKVNRPELLNALNFMRGGQDSLVVWRLDRLARSLLQLIETVNDLHNRKIGFRSLSENIDTSSSGGRLIFHLFSSIAEFERDLIQERTNAGLIAARSRGKIGGRPRAMDNASIVQAKALFAAGDLTGKEIAARLNVSVATLYRYIHSTP